MVERRPIKWEGSSLEDLRAFPDDARQKAGHQLDLVQTGQDPDDFRPVTTVGPGVQEIRIHTGREHRVFYVARFAEAIHVLHCFEKKTQQIRTMDIELARKRFREVQEQRKRKR